MIVLVLPVREVGRTYLVTPEGRRIAFVRDAVLAQLATVEDFGPRELVPVDVLVHAVGA